VSPSWGKGTAPTVRLLEFPLSSAPFFSVTTLLVYAAGLLVSFVVLGVGAFVYGIVADEKKEHDDPRD